MYGYRRVVSILVVVLLAVMLSGCLKPSKITVTPTEHSLNVDETKEFVATGTFNKTEKSLKNAVWTLSDPEIGTLSADKGTKTTFTAKKPGIATLTAKEGTVEGTAQVFVLGGLARLDVDPPTSTITSGGSYTYSAIAYDHGNNLITIDQDSLTWEADEEIGTFVGREFTAATVTEEVTGKVWVTLGETGIIGEGFVTVEPAIE